MSILSDQLYPKKPLLLIGATCLQDSHPSIVQDNRGLHGLPGHGTSLAQRVGFRRGGVDDDGGNGVFALQSNHAVGIFAEIHDWINVALGTGRGQKTSRGSRTGILVRGENGGFDVTNIFTGTNFSFPCGHFSVICNGGEAGQGA